MESLEITQDDKETQEEANEKDIQLEVVLPHIDNQKHDGENSSLPKEWSQEEGIDFDESFAPIARSKAIRMLLAFVAIPNGCKYCILKWIHHRGGICSITSGF